jgi:uncharacterized OB-fold protein
VPENLQIVDSEDTGARETLLPGTSHETESFERDLSAGALRLQACLACNRLRYPIAPVCPYCGCDDASWHRVSGLGHIHSWVRYWRAFSPFFEHLVPYVVVCAMLDEGPLLFGRLLRDRDPQTGARLRAVVERWPGDRFVLAFVQEGPNL